MAVHNILEANFNNVKNFMCVLFSTTSTPLVTEIKTLMADGEFIPQKLRREQNGVVD